MRSELPQQVLVPGKSGPQLAAQPQIVGDVLIPNHDCSPPASQGWRDPAAGQIHAGVIRRGRAVSVAEHLPSRGQGHFGGDHRLSQAVA